MNLKHEHVLTIEDFNVSEEEPVINYYYNFSPLLNFKQY